MSFRVLIIDDEGSIHRIPNSKFEKWINRQIAISSFANQTVRVAHFWGESTNKRFTKVHDISYSKMKFGSEGKIDEAFQLASMSALAKLLHMGPGTEIENQRRKFAEKHHVDTYRWKPTEHEELRFIDLVLHT